jgi:hypothetical protein
MRYDQTLDDLCESKNCERKNNVEQEATPSAKRFSHRAQRLARKRSVKVLGVPTAGALAVLMGLPGPGSGHNQGHYTQTHRGHHAQAHLTSHAGEVASVGAYHLTWADKLIDLASVKEKMPVLGSSTDQFQREIASIGEQIAKQIAFDRALHEIAEAKAAQARLAAARARQAQALAAQRQAQARQAALAQQQAQQAQAVQQASAGGVWLALRECESGDDYQTDTGNGYYGAYQFALPTWESLGFTGLPSQAPPAVQNEAARMLQARSGWGQWPVCAARLGLI